MNRKLALVSVAVTVLLVCIAVSGLVYWYGWPGGGGRAVAVSFSTSAGNASFECEVADVPAEWTAGLSGREALEPGTGMLFVFPAPSQQTFWMKGTLIPLDIIFIWANGTVGAICEAPVEPGVAADDLTRYESPGPVKWIVEVNMGACAAAGILPGSMLTIGG